MFRMILSRLGRLSLAILRAELEEARESGDWPVLQRRIAKHEDKAAAWVIEAERRSHSKTRRGRRRHRRALRLARHHRDAAFGIAEFIRRYSR